MIKRKLVWVYWFVIVAIGVLIIGFLSDVLLPFVVGVALAYFLDPVTDKLERLKLPRWLATTLVLFLFGIAFGSLGLLLIPIIHKQALQLASQIPGYVDVLRGIILPALGDLVGKYGIDLADDGQFLSRDSGGDLLEVLAKFLARLWTSGLALFNLLSMLIITPIVAFYLLRDFDKIVKTIDDYLPRSKAPIIRNLVREIDIVMAAFLRGQGTICLLLAIFYAGTLSLLGLDFGLAIGIISGIFSFIPFVGVIVGLLLSVLTAFGQFLPDGDFGRIVAVVVVFVVGQVLEGNILTPRLLGGQIGLHPLWILLSLVCGGALLGFLGILLAVPIAAVLGVVIRFSLKLYRDSEYYFDGKMEE